MPQTAKELALFEKLLFAAKLFTLFALAPAARSSARDTSGSAASAAAGNGSSRPSMDRAAIACSALEKRGALATAREGSASSDSSQEGTA